MDNRIHMKYDIKQISCPACGRESTEFLVHTDYKVEGYDALWAMMKCQRCGTELLITDKEDEVLQADKVTYRRVQSSYCWEI